MNNLRLRHIENLMVIKLLIFIFHKYLSFYLAFYILLRQYVYETPTMTLYTSNMMIILFSSQRFGFRCLRIGDALSLPHYHPLHFRSCGCTVLLWELT